MGANQFTKRRDAAAAHFGVGVEQLTSEMVEQYAEIEASGATNIPPTTIPPAPPEGWMTNPKAAAEYLHSVAMQMAELRGQIAALTGAERRAPIYQDVDDLDPAARWQPDDVDRQRAELEAMPKHRIRLRLPMGADAQLSRTLPLRLGPFYFVIPIGSWHTVPREVYLILVRAGEVEPDEGDEHEAPIDSRQNPALPQWQGDREGEVIHSQLKGANDNSGLILPGGRSFSRAV